MSDATGRWVVDDGPTIWWEFGVGEAMEPEEALRNRKDNQQFVPAYDALATLISEPTYEEVRAVISAAWQSDCPTPDWLDLAAHNVRALITGEEQADG